MDKIQKIRNHFISKELYDKWSSLRLVEETDFYKIRKLSNDKYAIPHIGNAIKSSYPMTEELYDLILLYYNDKLKLIISQRDIASKMVLE
jgi:hypothetical protein